MSKQVFALAAVIALVCAFAGTAASGIPRTGDQRVGLFACASTGNCPDLTLAANEAFYVVHGYTQEACADQRNPLHRFELYVDGAEQHGPVELTTTDNGLCDKLFVFDYRLGMTGTHTFTGCWYGPSGALDVCGTRVVHFV